MPRERTAVTAGDHIDCSTTSPEAIRLTDSSNVVQNARNWPCALGLGQDSIVLSISSLVMLPLSPYLMSPRASIAMAASMIPIEGTSTSAVLPLNSGLSSSAQLAIVAADQVGPDAERVGVVDRGDRGRAAGRAGVEGGRRRAFDVLHLVGQDALRSRPSGRPDTRPW